MGAALGEGKVDLAEEVEVSGMLLSWGDMVLVSNRAISLRAAVLAGGDLGLMGHDCDFVRRLSPSAAVYELQAGIPLMWLHGLRVRRAHCWARVSTEFPNSSRCNRALGYQPRSSISSTDCEDMFQFNRRPIVLPTCMVCT